MADYQTELSQSGTTLTLKPADGFQRSTVMGVSSTDTHQFSGSVYISGNLRAWTYKVDEVISGSTIFGNDATDTHQFTGSVHTSASVYVGDDLWISDNLYLTGSDQQQLIIMSDNADIFIRSTDNTQTPAAIGSGISPYGYVFLRNYDVSITNAIALVANDDSYFMSGNFGLGTNTPAAKLHVSGSTILGQASADTHQFTGSIYAVSNGFSIVQGAFGGANISGSGNLELGGGITAAGSSVFGDNLADMFQFTGSMHVTGTTHLSGTVLPGADNTIDLGSPSYRWANVYTADLHLKNDRGDWSIIEEEDYLCVTNNRTGKKYKMMLQEIDD